MRVCRKICLRGISTSGHAFLSTLPFVPGGEECGTCRPRYSNLCVNCDQLTGSFLSFKTDSGVKLSLSGS